MSEQTLDNYRERAVRLEAENLWLETELSIARLDAESERRLRRYTWVICIAMMVAIGVMSAVIAIALAGPR